MPKSRPIIIFTDLIMIVLIVLLPHVARMPMFVYPLIILLILWGYLRWKSQSFVDIGFRWKNFSWKSLWVGCLLGILWALVAYFFLGPLILRITGLPPADLSDFEGIRNNWNQFLLLLLIAWLLVIPYEEIVFRGFVFTAFRNIFNDPSMPINRIAGKEKGFDPKPGIRFWLAGLVHSILFAAYHWQEGASAVISIFLGAMLTIWLYKIFRANLWYLIFFHSAYDTVMLSLFRYGYL